jgi:alkyldihydroxyacetonephosphate synthase
VYPDGPAPYFTFLAPAHPEKALEQWAAIKNVAYQAISKYGGTSTHHHAVGRLHRPWYEQEVPLLVRRGFQATKKVFDPHNILNPGVLW